MALKRSPPPPPAESSEETDSGNVATDDELEEEVASSVARKNMAPPPQKVQVESSDEEEEEEEEEEQAVQEEDKEEAAEGEDQEEEEEESKANKDEEVAPQVKNKSKGKAVKSKGKFQRAWSKADEVFILEAHLAHRQEHGELPKPKELEAALAAKLSKGYSLAALTTKRRSLQSLYGRTKKNAPPSDSTDRRIFDLCKELWGGGDKAPTAKVPSDCGEMRKIYPYLAEELDKVEKDVPRLYKREFARIDEDEASKLDKKIRKRRVAQFKFEQSRYEAMKELNKVLMGLMP